MFMFWWTISLFLDSIILWSFCVVLCSFYGEKDEFVPLVTLFGLFLSLVSRIGVYILMECLFILFNRQVPKLLVIISEFIIHVIVGLGYDEIIIWVLEQIENNRR